MALRIVSIAQGQGFDITDRLTGLRWSSVDPGGDESASFTFHTTWFAANPEIGRGALLRIMQGIDVLWQGRIEETDRGGEQSEEISVTAYGLGARLKDGQFSVVFADRDLSSMRDIGRVRKLVLANALVENGSWAVDNDISGGVPAIYAEIVSGHGNVLRNLLYDAGQGNTVASVFYEPQQTADVTAALVGIIQVNASDSFDGTGDQTADLITGAGASVGAQATFTPSSAQRFVNFYFNAAGDLTKVYGYAMRRLAFFGNHGLTKRGSAPNQGFWASDLIRYIVGLVSGVRVRRIDETSFVLEQAEHREPVSHEDGIVKANESHAHERTWGTWGPDSPLDNSTDGQFDYKAKEPTVQHWTLSRADCDHLDLHSESSTLYNQVDVHYTDVTGQPQIVTRTIASPDLDGAGITRKYPLQGGKRSLTGAQQLGDAFLALSGGFAPARGSVTISRPIRHYQRGLLGPEYLRADGSNMRISDILPSTTLFTLDSTPDKRTTFPMKRVEVDASGPAITASVELDQANDTIAALQARLGLAEQLAGV